MRALRQYDSAIRLELHHWVKAVTEVDILVGIPCFNREKILLWTA